MTDTIFPPPAVPSLPVVGETARFAVGRIFCIGRNYAAHAAELGNTIDREAPFFFMKDANHLAQSGQDLPFPPATEDLHHEVELVVAIGGEGHDLTPDAAAALVWGYAIGLDMTRRDLQNIAKAAGRPWDTAKNFEDAAIIGPLTRGFEPDLSAPLQLTVNGALRQSQPPSDMVWNVAETVAIVSRLYHLRAGDLIMTGTPAGVGRVQPGDVLVGTFPGLEDLRVSYLS
ncbi:fumarylpyruvate hydrolase [Ketogulonicigenium robustum]|uniref:Fumarylpyruvate hydrolase n=1 Tax=Ketogulonicigenium robustum TaxID=92947 RepID=A0A1W6P049_9RHOB|nr:fumarylacetoacetate hydrolase family protein [Ketogulonicigenium robustum]ARO14819.1 fumarylpyruvate hydrolase [Ketogulonicigenium robustum]